MVLCTSVIHVKVKICCFLRNVLDGKMEMWVMFSWNCRRGRNLISKQPLVYRPYINHHSSCTTAGVIACDFLKRYGKTLYTGKTKTDWLIWRIRLEDLLSPVFICSCDTKTKIKSMCICACVCVCTCVYICLECSQWWNLLF